MTSAARWPKCATHGLSIPPVEPPDCGGGEAGTCVPVRDASWRPSPWGAFRKARKNGQNLWTAFWAAYYVGKWTR